MLTQSLHHNPQAIAGRNTSCRKLIAQVAGGKLILCAAIGALYCHTSHWLVSLERDLARHWNQVKRSGWCLCGSGTGKPGKYSE